MRIMRRTRFRRAALGTLASLTLAASPVLQTGSPIDREARVKEVTATKERHKKLLWSLPQVTGVGVG
ncbi:MAG: hypothetical protein ACREUU_00710, partial [Gammaproteobacteria bacterium]